MILQKNPFPFPPKNAFFRQITQILLGCDIFDELCLRIDVNQKYAELLPQWKDVAQICFWAWERKASPEEVRGCKVNYM